MQPGDPRTGHAGGVRRDAPSMFGAPVQRREDPRLLTGGGRYLDDLGHDALAAAFVRSPHAHARIVDIDVADALRRRRASSAIYT